jgi:hypothetical protein
MALHANHILEELGALERLAATVRESVEDLNQAGENLSCDEKFVENTRTHGFRKLSTVAATPHTHMSFGTQTPAAHASSTSIASTFKAKLRGLFTFGRSESAHSRLSSNSMQETREAELASDCCSQETIKVITTVLRRTMKDRILGGVLMKDLTAHTKVGATLAR